MSGFSIRRTDFSEKAVEKLVLFHLAMMHQTSPADSVFALGLDALRQPDVAGFAAWEEDALLGIGALKRGAGYSEIKSMRTVPDALGRGVGSAILSALEDEARHHGSRSLKLETGPPPHFLAANRFYEKHGFSLCGPFGDYRENAHSIFYEKSL